MNRTTITYVAVYLLLAFAIVNFVILAHSSSEISPKRYGIVHTMYDDSNTDALTRHKIVSAIADKKITNNEYWDIIGDDHIDIDAVKFDLMSR